MAQVSPTQLESGFRQLRLVRARGPVQDRFGIVSEYYESELTEKSNFEMRISALETEVRRLRKESVGYVKVNRLPNKNLRIPLDVIVETDGEGFIARAVDLPLYGHAEDPFESLEMLKREVESLYNDLVNDEDLTADWLRIKSFLVERIGT